MGYRKENSDLSKTEDILKLAQEAAKEIEHDGMDKYPALQKRCDKMFSDEIIMN